MSEYSSDFETDPVSGVPLDTVEAIRRMGNEVRRELDAEAASASASQAASPEGQTPQAPDPLDWRSKALQDAENAVKEQEEEKRLASLAEALLFKQGVPESSLDRMTPAEKIREARLGNLTEDEQRQIDIDVENEYLMRPENHAELFRKVAQKGHDRFVSEYVTNHNKGDRLLKARQHGLHDGEVDALEKQYQEFWRNRR